MSHKYPCECCGHPCQVYGSRYCADCGDAFCGQWFKPIEQTTVSNELRGLDEHLQATLAALKQFREWGCHGQFDSALKSADTAVKYAYRIRRILDGKEASKK